MLIVHGTNDNIVHPDYAQRAFEAYFKRSAPKALVHLEMIEGGSHGFSKKHDTLALEKLDRFLKKLSESSLSALKLIYILKGGANGKELV